jgi:hypothetical protein
VAHHAFSLLDKSALGDGPRRWNGEWQDVDYDVYGVADGVVTVHSKFTPED